MFKEWSMLFRSQTAPATVILAMIGFLVGGGLLFSFFGLLLFVFFILLHCFIFGNNSLMDACIVPKIGELSYDARDKSKKHHPLITGKIKFSTAHKVIYTGLIFLACIAVILSFYGTGDTALSLAFFVIFTFTGFAYNCGLSKVTVWKFLPLATCFSSLFCYAYFIMADKINNLFILILIYIFLTEIFQVGIEGEQKDIETETEVNLLKILGTKISGNKIYMSITSKIVSWFIKLSILVVGISIFIKVGPSLSSILLFCLFMISIIYFSARIIHEKDWGRDKKLRYYGLSEISTIYLLLSILIPVIGIFEVITLMFFGVVYFTIFNIFNWSTFFAPKV